MRKIILTIIIVIIVIIIVINNLEVRSPCSIRFNNHPTIFSELRIIFVQNFGFQVRTEPGCGLNVKSRQIFEKENKRRNKTKTKKIKEKRDVGARKERRREQKIM